MPQYKTRDLTIEQAAAFLGVTPATVRRRMRARELRSVKTVGGAAELVRMAPYDDWLRVEDASQLLHLSTAAIRSRVQRAVLSGRREDKRWRVLLASILDQPEVDLAALELFGGNASDRPEPEQPPPRPPARLRRDMHFLFDEEEIAILEEARQRHGTYLAAIVAGLRADSANPIDLDDVAELRVNLDATRQSLERERRERQALKERAVILQGDVVACHDCDRFVPVEELRWVQVEDGSSVLHHGEHKLRQPNRLRGPLGNVLAARPASAAR